MGRGAVWPTTDASINAIIFFHANKGQVWPFNQRADIKILSSDSTSGYSSSGCGGFWYRQGPLRIHWFTAKLIPEFLPYLSLFRHLWALGNIYLNPLIFWAGSLQKSLSVGNFHRQPNHGLVRPPLISQRCAPRVSPDCLSISHVFSDSQTPDSPAHAH